MKTKSLSLTILLLVAFLLGACGTPATPPPIPQPTAVPPTDTPVPSPTPMPYDLTVTVADEQGSPISWATITLIEIDQSVAVDAGGQVTWGNLSQANFTLRVTAQGYAGSEEQISLDRGPNEKTVTLTRVPFGLLPSQACAPGETLLYAEDFQDGAVDNWGTYPQGIEIPIEADPSAPDNKVLLLNFGATDGQFSVLGVPSQDNVVRRMKYMPGDHSRFNVGFGKGDPGYFIVLSADGITLNFYSGTTGEKKLARGNPVMAQGVWHLLEFSSYNGRLEVWADGQLAAAIDGAISIVEGNIMSIGSAFLPPESVVRIDDVSLCGLSAPFAPMPAATP